ncbi:hypothetical protein MUK42_37150 [Musa troglodytarum]|uniref:Uncharacterized protein n=1 Tax=Musa troglodytarum TaxID=320322 RepID=A0A9E7FGB7_9LILI|nr:hypothetical protein MUK42_37150 [Musa troglodytarum]
MSPSVTSIESAMGAMQIRSPDICTTPNPTFSKHLLNSCNAGKDASPSASPLSPSPSSKSSWLKPRDKRLLEEGLRIGYGRVGEIGWDTVAGEVEEPEVGCGGEEEVASQRLIEGYDRRRSWMRGTATRRWAREGWSSEKLVEEAGESVVGVGGKGVDQRLVRRRRRRRRWDGCVAKAMVVIAEAEVVMVEEDAIWREREEEINVCLLAEQLKRVLGKPVGLNRNGPAFVDQAAASPVMLRRRKRKQATLTSVKVGERDEADAIVCLSRPTVPSTQHGAMFLTA